ncbi:MAG TPA: ABC transporter permease [Pedococcus sp.]|jgi:ABC-2 type transport system permease protein|uniref:ABC transporter permease n=1 Tax=Pedococcus sp. TaxID=2860345 RepID=UPI002F91C5A0
MTARADQLAAEGAAAGFDPGRTLRFWVEVRRQLRRRRTVGIFAVMLALPLLLVLAFAVGDEPDGRRGVSLIDVATNGSLNFVLFVLFVSTGFLLVVVFALFFGDTVASEAGWGTLRYLLAIPVPRPRLLARKLLVALFLSAAALVTLVLMSMAVGAVFYGWSPVTTPVGFQLEPGEALARLAGITAYLVVGMTMVGSLAFMLSVRTDAPLAAVGGTVLIVIVSSILDQIDALGAVRDWLPTRYTMAWVGMLQDPPDTADMLRGVLFALGYAVVFLVLAFHHFQRKDVVS